MCVGASAQESALRCVVRDHLESVHTVCTLCTHGAGSISVSVFMAMSMPVKVAIWPYGHGHVHACESGHMAMWPWPCACVYVHACVYLLQHLRVSLHGEHACDDSASRGAGDDAGHRTILQKRLQDPHVVPVACDMCMWYLWHVHVMWYLWHVACGM